MYSACYNHYIPWQSGVYPKSAKVVQHTKLHQYMCCVLNSQADSHSLPSVTANCMYVGSYAGLALSYLTSSRTIYTKWVYIQDSTVIILNTKFRGSMISPSTLSLNLSTKLLRIQDLSTLHRNSVTQREKRNWGLSLWNHWGI